MATIFLTVLALSAVIGMMYKTFNPELDSCSGTEKIL